MYNHIKKGNLVRITGISYIDFKNLPIYLVIDKKSENGFYCKCNFCLLNEKGHIIWFYADANNPYQDIKLAIKD